MELYYKTSTLILLLLHSSQTGSQTPAVTEPPEYVTDWYPDGDGGDHTDSTGRTIDPEWLRQPAVNGRIEDQETMVSSGETTMSISSGEGSDTDAGQDQDNVTVLSTVLSVFQNHTAAAEESAETTTTAAPTTGPAERVNVTGAEEEEEEEGSTTTAPPPTSGFPDLRSNGTDLNDTVGALTPETDDTQPGPSSESNATEHTTGVTTTTEGPLIYVESTTSLTTTDLPPPETTAGGASNGTTVAPDTPGGAANMTDEDLQASGTNSERGSSGLASETGNKSSRKSEAWSAVLGTGVAVAFVGMVVYVIMRKRRQRDFSHRKLVEEFPSDPVLRLDNSEPLDLNFGGSAYYNRAMQADDIQMNSFSGGQRR